MTRNWIQGGNAGTIAASIEQGLHGGRAAGGDALPTVRELAATLEVSPATVAAAYKLLRTRGLIAGQGRQGTRFAARPATPIGAVAPAIPPGTVDLASGSPDPDLLPPFDTALRSIRTESRLYGDEPHLRALVAFAAADFESDGIPSGSISVLSGALDAVERILREHLRPGDRVAVEDPSFPGITDLVQASGFIAVPFAIDDEGPLPDSIEQALKGSSRALIVTPRAQNPTGAAISPARAVALRKVLRRFPDAVLIEND